MSAKLGLVDKKYDSRQALFVDVNNDSRLDLFVVHNQSPSKLYLQSKDGKFVDSTKNSGISTKLGALTAVFFDSNNNGLLDLYIGNYGLYKSDPSFNGHSAERSQLYLNQGGGKFKDISEQSGLDTKAWAMAAAALDVNKDGYQDLYVSNDFGYDELWINQKNNSFINEAKMYGTNFRGNGMNVSFLDADGDLEWDVYISAIDMFSKGFRFNFPQDDTQFTFDDEVYKSTFYISGNQLFVNKKDRPYASIAENFFSPGDRGWSWGASFFDIDNDGDQDFYLANGYIKNSPANNQKNQFFINKMAFGSRLLPKALLILWAIVVQLLQLT